ncbi:MAG: branched-chain amino acid transport system II carrier protein [Sphaerochaetaceae bacterium]|nr:branched-chain amino acid transport system II carrier protein [Sphaerochaetaceae bacterium]
MKKLTSKQTIIVASTLFGMFFGAGNLIFPVHLGQIAGSSVWPATIGFIITAVGIPILGVAAIGSTHSDGLQELSSRVSPGYGYFFTCLLYLTIGPFFAIPRCATTSFTVGMTSILGTDANLAVAQLIFSLVFFVIVLLFSLKPGKITTSIGKFINPVFLTLLLILVVCALANPGASVSEIEPAEAYKNAAFFNGFIEGYGTMDAIAGLAFGIVVINIIRSMGITKDSRIAKDVIRSGVWTGALMAIIYLLTIIMGAQSRGLFATSDNGGIALAQISTHYLGKAGSILLALTITFACLKTAMGLVISCSESFEKMFKGKIKYRTLAIIITAFSFLVSNIGLNSIITYSIPVLMFIYPMAITLILLALTGKWFGHDSRVYKWVTGFAAVAAVFDLLKTLPSPVTPAVNLAREILPFFDIGLGWVVPSLIGLAIGLILHFAKPVAE